MIATFVLWIPEVLLKVCENRIYALVDFVKVIERRLLNNYSPCVMQNFTLPQWEQYQHILAVEPEINKININKLIN